MHRLLQKALPNPNNLRGVKDQNGRRFGREAPNTILCLVPGTEKTATGAVDEIPGARGACSC